MKNELFVGCFLWVAVNGLSAPLPTTIADFHQPGTQPSGYFEPVTPIQSQTTCAECHKLNFDNGGGIFQWAGSMMAHASIDPLFEACLTIAEQDAPGSGDLCMRCHIPKAWLGGRSKPTSGSAVLPEDRIGVSCAVCHRMVNPVFEPNRSPSEDLSILGKLGLQGVQPQNHANGMYVVNSSSASSLQYRGPRAKKLNGDNVVSPGHQIVVSPFHRDASLCGTCHDVSNPVFDRQANGTYKPNAMGTPATSYASEKIMPIERTFSEWKHSAFNSPAGVTVPVYGTVSTCQDCHMRRRGGESTRLGTDSYGDLASHDLTGGNAWVPQLLAKLYPGKVDAAALNHGIERVRETLRSAAELVAVQEGLYLKVTVKNNTGHKLPSGYPEGRRMWLTVGFRDKDDHDIKWIGQFDHSIGEIEPDPELKIYEAQSGIDSQVANLTGLPSGHSFHFVLNNQVIKDNRIPPRGFKNSTFAGFGAAPVAYSYADGQYWDDTYFTIPFGAKSVLIYLHYQTASKEYIDFLRDANKTNQKGKVLHDLWDDLKSPPELMNYFSLGINGPDTLYVNADAPFGPVDGLSWSRAWRNLSDALEMAENDQGVKTIRVAKGTYRPPPPTFGSSRLATFRVRGGLTIIGGYDPSASDESDPIKNPTTLSGYINNRGTGENAYHVVTVVNGNGRPSTELSGLIIRGGDADFQNGEGGGVLVVQEGTLHLTRCVVKDNSASRRGGGISLVNGSLNLHRCEVSGNSADEAGGVYSGSGNQSLSITAFRSNRARAGNGGAIVAGGPMSIINCAFVGNSANSGGSAGAMFLTGSDLKLINCTVTANTADGRSGGILWTYNGLLPGLSIFNSILWGNTDSNGTATISQLFSVPPSPKVQYTCIQDAVPGDGQVFPGEGNIDRNPLLIDAAHGDLRLAPNSPAIDAGDNRLSDWVGNVDLAFHPRNVDDPFTPDTGKGNLLLVDLGALEFIRILYVDSHRPFPTTGTGASWDKAFAELWRALEMAHEPDSQVEQVWVAKGYYRPGPNLNPGVPDRSLTFRMRTGLALYGGLAGGETSLAGRDPDLNVTYLSGDLSNNDNRRILGDGDPRADNCYHVVTIDPGVDSVVLDGFNIRGGNANLRGGQGAGLMHRGQNLNVANCWFSFNDAFSSGGGMAILGPGPTQIENSRFSFNSAYQGGGLFAAQGSVYLNRTEFLSNEAAGGDGGGCTSSDSTELVLANCLMRANTASQNGGGMAPRGAAVVIINSTFFGNTAQVQGGGIYSPERAPSIFNSIFWANAASSHTLAENQIAGLATVSFTCVQDNMAGDGQVYSGIANIDRDPRFLGAGDGNLRLKTDSPCIDAGKNAALSAEYRFDLAGSARFQDVATIPDTGQGAKPVVDLGAYEVPALAQAPATGDLNRNGRVDPEDFEGFVRYMTGPDRTASAAARFYFDFDQDGDIDLVDFLEFQRLMTQSLPMPSTLLDLTISSGGINHVTVAPGASVPYEVRGKLRDPASQGLAAIVLDLAFDGGPLGPGLPPADGSMTSFVPLDGFTNPGGFGGTSARDGALMQAGGAQNLIRNSLENFPFPTGDVTLGIAKGDAHVIFVGTANAPLNEGTYSLSLMNILGAAIRASADPRAPLAVDRIAQGHVTNLVIHVQVNATVATYLTHPTIQNAVISFTFLSQTNKSHVIEFKKALHPEGVWEAHSTVAGDGLVKTVSDPVKDTRFYRVVTR